MSITEIFNTREIAVCICVLLLLVFILANKSIKISFIKLLKSAFATNLLYIYIVATLYTIIGISFLYSIDFWKSSYIKDSLVWLLFSASITLFRVKEAEKDKKFFVSALKDNFKFSLIVEFIIGKFTFNILLELLLIIVGVMVGGIRAFASKDEKYKDVKTLMDIIILFIGISTIYFYSYQLFQHFRTYATYETLKEFALPIILSLWFIPFVYVVYLYISYEIVFEALKVSIKDKVILSYARQQALINFKVDVEGLKRWKDSLLFSDIDTKNRVHESIYNIKRLQRIEKNPATVDKRYGWSPYLAKEFLASHGVKTGYYKDSYDDEWYALSPSIELDQDIIPNSITYYINGNDTIVNKMRIVLNLYSKINEENTINTFREYAETLCRKALNENLPNTIIQAVLERKSKKLVINGLRFTVEKEEWLNKNKGYTIKFIIEKILDKS